MAYPAAMSTHPSLSQELWERPPPAVRAYIEAVDACQASRDALEARVAALAALVQALPEQLNQTARHSSRPPARDPPQPDRPRRPRCQRRRGGQLGHPGPTRTLIPVDAVQEVVVIKPEQCLHCDAPLRGDDPQPWRHQVIELPPLKPVVTDYQWHQVGCAACGEVTRAPWPEGVPSGTYGPGIQATGALCTGA
jgi:transposase